MKKLKHLWLYLVVLGTILMLIAGNYFISAYNAKENDAYVHTIHLAEQQLSLSQWLVKAALFTSFTNTTDSIPNLKQLQHWNDVHNSLQWADGSYGLYLHFPDGIISGFIKLNPVQKDLYNNLKRALTKKKADSAVEQRILKLEQQYYADMSNIASAIGQRGHKIAEYGNHIGELICIILGLAILLEIALLIFPYHIKLHKANAQLQERNREIELHKRSVENMSDMQNLIITGTNAGIWEWDLVTDAVFWSPRLYRMIGYEKDEIPSGFPMFLTLLHPDDKAKEEDARIKHFRDRTPYSIEVRLLNKDGGYRWYEITGQAIWDAKGQPICMAGSVIDIHDQTLYRSQLEYNEYMLREAGKLAQVGSWEYTVATGKFMWSSTMYEINEMEPSEDVIDGSRINMYLPPEREKLSRLFNAAITEGAPYDVETIVRTAKGNKKWVRIISRSIKDENGKVIKLRGVYQDITQQKVRELEMKRMQDKLAESNATKDKLFSIIAHDLRSPINNMKSLIDMKQEGILTQEEFMTYLGQIKQNTDYLSSAMDNMLHWAIGQMEGFKMKPRNVNIADTVANALNLYSGQIEDKRITVINNTHNTDFAYADPDQLFLIVRNLLSNAIKFTPIGGHIYLESIAKGGIMRFSVQDNGSGITEEDLKKIRIKSAMHSTRGTEGEKGTGLGLSLCFEMAGLNNGGIDIISKPGKGSIFTLTLPAKPTTVSAVVS